eukprot:ANDGO_05648.mRNA.1 hypothetical protein
MSQGKVLSYQLQKPWESLEFIPSSELVKSVEASSRVVAEQPRSKSASRDFLGALKDLLAIHRISPGVFDGDVSLRTEVYHPTWRSLLISCCAEWLNDASRAGLLCGLLYRGLTIASNQNSSDIPLGKGNTPRKFGISDILLTMRDVNEFAAKSQSSKGFLSGLSSTAKTIDWFDVVGRKCVSSSSDYLTILHTPADVLSAAVADKVDRTNRSFFICRRYFENQDDAVKTAVIEQSLRTLSQVATCFEKEASKFTFTPIVLESIALDSIKFLSACVSQKLREGDSIEEITSFIVAFRSRLKSCESLETWPLISMACNEFAAAAGEEFRSLILSSDSSDWCLWPCPLNRHYIFAHSFVTLLTRLDDSCFQTLSSSLVVWVNIFQVCRAFPFLVYPSILRFIERGLVAGSFDSTFVARVVQGAMMIPFGIFETSSAWVDWSVSGVVFPSSAVDVDIPEHLFQVSLSFVEWFCMQSPSTQLSKSFNMIVDIASKPFKSPLLGNHLLDCLSVCGGYVAERSEKQVFKDSLNFILDFLGSLGGSDSVPRLLFASSLIRKLADFDDLSDDVCHRLVKILDSFSFLVQQTGPASRNHCFLGLFSELCVLVSISLYRLLNGTLREKVREILARLSKAVDMPVVRQCSGLVSSSVMLLSNIPSKMSESVASVLVLEYVKE